MSIECATHEGEVLGHSPELYELFLPNYDFSPEDRTASGLLVEREPLLRNP